VCFILVETQWNSFELLHKKADLDCDKCPIKYTPKPADDGDPVRSDHFFFDQGVQDCYQCFTEPTCVATQKADTQNADFVGCHQPCLENNTDASGCGRSVDGSSDFCGCADNMIIHGERVCQDEVGVTGSYLDICTTCSDRFEVASCGRCPFGGLETQFERNGTRAKKIDDIWGWKFIPTLILQNLPPIGLKTYRDVYRNAMILLLLKRIAFPGIGPNGIGNNFSGIMRLHFKIPYASEVHYGLFAVHDPAYKSADIWREIILSVSCTEDQLDTMEGYHPWDI